MKANINPTGVLTLRLSENETVESVSDGLSSPCYFCKRVPVVDYVVDDQVWKTVVPKEAQHHVVCLECFNNLAIKVGIEDWPRSVLFVSLAVPANTTIFRKVVDIVRNDSSLFDEAPLLPNNLIAGTAANEVPAAGGLDDC